MGEATTHKFEQLNNTRISNQFQLNSTYENVFNKKDSASISNSNHTFLAFRNISYSNTYHFLFAAAYQKQKRKIALENKDRWLSYATYTPQKLTWAMSAKLNNVNLHYFNAIDKQGFTIGVEPIPQTKLYVKRQKDFFFWSNTAEVFTSDELHHVNYSINYIETMNGFGFHHSNDRYTLMGEYLRDSEKKTEQRLISSEWFFNRHWSASVNYRYDRKDNLDDFIYINQTLNGRWLQKTNKQSFILMLTNKNHVDVFFQQTALNYKTQGIYSASEFAGYWGDFFVGAADFHSSLNINVTTIGVAYGNKAQSRYFKEKKSGLVWKMKLSFGRAIVDSSGRHSVAKIPLGFIVNEKLSTDINRIDLVVTELSIGYKTKSWGMFYEMKQILPLRIHSDNADTVRASSASSISLQLPDGNRQTLNIIYYLNN